MAKTEKEKTMFGSEMAEISNSTAKSLTSNG